MANNNVIWGIPEANTNVADVSAFSFDTAHSTPSVPATAAQSVEQATNPPTEVQPTSQTPTPSPAETTAVVSSNAAREQTSQNQNRLQDVNQQLEDIKNKALNFREQLSLIEANQKTGTDIIDGEDTETTEDDFDERVEAMNAAIDEQYQASINLLDSAISTSDNNTQELIRQIETMFGARVEAQKEVNRRFERGVKTAGMVSGAARFTPEIQAGIIADAERIGLQKITEIVAEEMSLILEANQANDDNQFGLLNEKIGLLREKSAQKQEAIQSMYQNVLEEEQLRMDRAKHNLDLAKGEADLRQKDFNIQVDVAEQYAPSLVAEVAAVGTPDEQRDYILDTALGLGIDPAALIKAMDDYQKEDAKFNLDLANIESQINKRDFDKRMSVARFEADRADAGGVGTASNPLGWSTEQLRKLRSFGVDPSNIEGASQVIYGDNKARAFTEEQLKAVGDALVDKADAQTALDQLGTGTITSDGKTYRLTPGQVEFIQDWVLSSPQERDIPFIPFF